MLQVTLVTNPPNVGITGKKFHRCLTSLWIKEGTNPSAISSSCVVIGAKWGEKKESQEERFKIGITIVEKRRRLNLLIEGVAESHLVPWVSLGLNWCCRSPVNWPKPKKSRKEQTVLLFPLIDQDKKKTNTSAEKWKQINRQKMW